MSSSRFLSNKVIRVAPPKNQMLKKSNFAGGQDSLTSIEELGPNVSPYLRNARNTHQGSIGMKKGPGFYGKPGGETASVSQTSVTGAANQVLTPTQWVASAYTPLSTARLTRLDLNLKTGSPAGTAPLLVELWSDSGTGPLAKLAGTSISSPKFTSSYQYLSAYFIEAPLLVSGTKYWIVAYQQSNGIGQYAWSSSSTYTGGLASVNSGVSWSSINGLNFTAYLSTDGGVLGGDRFAFSSGSKFDVIAIKEAAGTTGVYWINPSTGALTAISTGLSSSATNYSFAFSNDLMVYVNGFDAPRQWTGIADTAVPNIGPFLSAPVSLVVNHKNRWFFLEGTTSRVVFSEPGDITTYLSTNFIYIPAPKSGDPANSMFRLQDNLWFGTRKTKYVLYGADLSSFVLRQSTATKGIINQNCVTVDGNFAYFASDDGIYSCNGATDELLSRSITPDYLAIPDLTKGFLIVWNNNLRFYFPFAGSAVNNGMMMLDLINSGWFIDSNAYVGRAFKYRTKGDPLSMVECSSLVGQAFYAEQQYSDLGKPIKLEYFDAPLSFGDPGIFKQIMFYYVRFVAQAGSYQVDCQMDKDLQNSPASNLVNMQGSGAVWGTAVWGAFNWGQPNLVEQNVPVSGEYHYFQPRFVITGADTPIEIQGYTIYYLAEAPR